MSKVDVINSINYIEKYARPFYRFKSRVETIKEYVEQTEEKDNEVNYYKDLLDNNNIEYQEY